MKLDFIGLKTQTKAIIAKFFSGQPRDLDKQGEQELRSREAAVKDDAGGLEREKLSSLDK